VSASVNRETLEELLREQHESAELDYKSSIDMRETRDVVELAKDVGAMLMKGGYLVIGADDYGQPTGQLADEQLPLLDEATLRAKLARYLPDGFQIQVGLHEINAQRIAVIYVEPHPAGFAVFKRVGQIDNKVIFSAGQIYVRRGTASTPCTQEELEKVVGARISRSRDEWGAKIDGPLLRAVKLAVTTNSPKGSFLEPLWENIGKAPALNVVSRIEFTDGRSSIEAVDVGTLAVGEQKLVRHRIEGSVRGEIIRPQVSAVATYMGSSGISYRSRLLPNGLMEFD
jgi:hypothetical protein